MKKLFCAVMLVSLLIASSVSVSAADAPFAEFIPASEVALNGSACKLVDGDGSINDKVLTCTTKADDVNGNGFTLTFTVPEDGEYTIWARVFYPGQVNNSLHYAVDGGTAQIWDLPDEDAADCDCYSSWQYFYLTHRLSGTFSDKTIYGDWSIENNQWRHAPNVLSLKAGEHSIKFTGREDGWIIDEFIITELKYEEYDPNASDDNVSILDVCKFCGTDWVHYYEDIYATSGVTAEEYYNTVLFPDEAVTSTDGTTIKAPSTFDAVTLAVACAAISGVIISKKRK